MSDKKIRHQDGPPVSTTSLSADPAADLWKRILEYLVDQAANSLDAALKLLTAHVSHALEIARSRQLAGLGPPADEQAVDIIAAVRRDVGARLDLIEAVIRAGRL